MKDKPRFFHARRMELVAGGGVLEARQHPCGGLTLAYVASGDVLRVSVARCNPADRYDKSHGDRLATLRMRKGEFVELPMKGDVYGTLWQYISGNRRLRRDMRCTLKHER